MNKNNKMVKESDYLEILNEYKLLKEAHNVLEMKYLRKCNEIHPLELENEWLSNRNGDLAELNQGLEKRVRFYEEMVEQNKREFEELRSKAHRAEVKWLRGLIAAAKFGD